MCCAGPEIQAELDLRDAVTLNLGEDWYAAQPEACLGTHAQEVAAERDACECLQ